MVKMERSSATQVEVDYALNNTISVFFTYYHLV
jgi:hypothetical protein